MLNVVQQKGIGIILRSEGAIELALALTVYARLHASWQLFMIAFLLPDLALLGYVHKPQTGAIAYNLTHSYIVPLGMALFSLGFAPWLLPWAIIWAAHIGFDRALGYGLKSQESFRQTHLGLVGFAKR